MCHLLCTSGLRKTGIVTMLPTMPVDIAICETSRDNAAAAEVSTLSGNCNSGPDALTADSDEFEQFPSRQQAAHRTLYALEAFAWNAANCKLQYDLY